MLTYWYSVITITVQINGKADAHSLKGKKKNKHTLICCLGNTYAHFSCSSNFGTNGEVFIPPIFTRDLIGFHRF